MPNRPAMGDGDAQAQWRSFTSEAVMSTINISATKLAKEVLAVAQRMSPVFDRPILSKICSA